MIEYYAVIGLACLDDEFRDALEKGKGNIRSIEKLMKAYGFRLSRYETGEVARLMNIPTVVEGMKNTYDSQWDELCPCLTAMTHADDYSHPTFFACKKDGSEQVIFAKDSDVAKKREARQALEYSNTQSPVTGE
jgi:hypothetical protein